MPELLAVFRHINRAFRGADQLDVKLREDPLARQIERTVEGGLPAHRRQQRVGTLGFNNLGHGLPAHRFDIGRIRRAGVGHDGGGIGVHEHDPITLLAQCTARLGPRIVEFAGLPDHNRSRPKNKDALNIVAFRHISANSRSAVTTATHQIDKLIE